MTISDKAGNLHAYYPRQIRMEVAQGCTRNCAFCGIRTVGNIVFKMDRTVMDAIVDHLPLETKRIDFALGGEPLLNEDLPYFIHKLKHKHPKVQISILSNTDILVYKHKSIDYLLELFHSGLNSFPHCLHNLCNTGFLL